MSAEMDKATDASGGDEEEWLYGGMLVKTDLMTLSSA